MEEFKKLLSQNYGSEAVAAFHQQFFRKATTDDAAVGKLDKERMASFGGGRATTALSGNVNPVVTNPFSGSKLADFLDTQEKNKK